MRNVTNDSNDTDDRRLVQSTLAGDQDAFGILVERHQDRIFNTLVRVLGCRDDARDMVQDAFVQAFVKLESFRGDAKFYTWVYRIAMNLALSHRRRRRPIDSLDAAKENVGQEPMSQQPTAAQALLDQERVDQLQHALLQLGDEHRQILVLREFEGCDYEAISEILDMPVGTVRSRLYRARMQLKQQLRKMLPDEIAKSE
ncbi:MAG: sigma-70 family RNA polymerase sigma factor [Planctomycetota bacterium]